MGTARQRFINLAPAEPDRYAGIDSPLTRCGYGHVLTSMTVLTRGYEPEKSGIGELWKSSSHNGFRPLGPWSTLTHIGSTSAGSTAPWKQAMVKLHRAMSGTKASRDLMADLQAMRSVRCEQR